MPKPEVRSVFDIGIEASVDKHGNVHFSDNCELVIITDVKDKSAPILHGRITERDCIRLDNQNNMREWN